MEIVARRLGEALAGETIESAVAPGINALKTFDPPLSALDGATIEGVRRRGKLLMLDAGGLTLLMHLMSAGRLQLFPKRATMRDRTTRVGLRLSEDRELRLREFGTKQRAWVKLLRPGGGRGGRVAGARSGRRRGPTRRTSPSRCARRRGRCTRCCATSRSSTGIGRTWVDEILHAARLSPFKRGDDLSDEEAERAARGDGLRARPRRSTSTRSRSRCRCPRSSPSPPASTTTRASPARAARPCSRPSSTRITS